MTNKTIKIIGLISVLLVCSIGLVTINTTVHELKHYFDVKDNSRVTDICVLNIPFENFIKSPIGYVHYYPNNETVKVSELKANLYSLPVTLLLATLVTIYLVNYPMFRRENEK